jgi:hypothetical protein
MFIKMELGEIRPDFHMQMSIIIGSKTLESSNENPKTTLAIGSSLNTILLEIKIRLRKQYVKSINNG